MDKQEIVVGGIYRFDYEFVGDFVRDVTVTNLSDDPERVEAVDNLCRDTDFMHRLPFTPQAKYLIKQVGYDARYSDAYKNLRRELDNRFSDLTAIDRVKELALGFDLPSEVFVSLRERTQSEIEQMRLELQELEKQSWLAGETDD